MSNHTKRTAGPEPWPSDEDAAAATARQAIRRAIRTLRSGLAIPEPIERDVEGRRFRWCLDAERGRYFRYFLDVDDRWTVDKLTGEIVRRSDDDGGPDDDPPPAPQTPDDRERIRAAKPESQTGPPPDPETANPACQGGAQAVDDEFGQRQQPEFKLARESFPPRIFGGGELRPERGRR